LAAVTLTCPAAGWGCWGVPVSDRDSPLITVQSGTPRARHRWALGLLQDGSYQEHFLISH